MHRELARPPKDYEVIEWTNSALNNFDNNYAHQAFSEKKWAFVSDYIRLYALKKYGGFYFDTDLEITNDISCFRHLDFFTGYEKYKHKFSPVTALMGSIPNHKIISDLLKGYDNINFIDGDNPNLTTNTNRISSYFAEKFRLQEPYNGEKITTLSPTEKIFPYYYFCSKKDGFINYSIHHFDGSWLEDVTIKNQLNFGLYKIVRYKYKSIIDSSKVEVGDNEKLLFSIRTSKNKRYCFIKIKKSP